MTETLLDDLNGMLDDASTMAGSLSPDVCNMRRDEIDAMRTKLAALLPDDGVVWLGNMYFKRKDGGNISISEAGHEIMVLRDTDIKQLVVRLLLL